MELQAKIVRINSAVFVAYGIAFIFLPGLFSQYVTGAAPASASGMIDMRATYGGMSVAVGALLFSLGADPNHLRKGLLGVILIMLGMAIGRLYGMIADGSPNQVMYIYLFLEVAMAAVAGWAFARGEGD